MPTLDAALLCSSRAGGDLGCESGIYRKDTEPLHHYFMYSLVSLLSGIYQLPAMHSLLFTFRYILPEKGPY